MVKLAHTPQNSLNADPNAAVLKSMRRIAQAIEVRSREIARTSGLTIPQLIVMQSIRALGQVTTQAVSKAASSSARSSG